MAGITTVGADGGAAAYSHTHTGYATSNHTHATSIATSNEDSRITLAFGTKYAIKAGGTSYVFAMPKNPNTDTTYTFATGDTKGQIKVTPSSGDAYNVNVNGLGSAAFTESSAYAPVGHLHTGYATSSHNHSGVYKPVQTAVSDPTASTTTSTTFIDTISQNANGVIAATKQTLPTASTTVVGITTVGASGGAAAYKHSHDTSITTSNGTNQITLAFGTKYAISAGGTSYVFSMPVNPNTNTTYTIATGDAKGQIKVTPSSGDAYNVSV